MQTDQRQLSIRVESYEKLFPRNDELRPVLYGCFAEGCYIAISDLMTVCTLIFETHAEHEAFLASLSARENRTNLGG